MFGALADKDVRGIVEPLLDLIGAWQLAGLAGESPRGLDASALGDLVQSARPGIEIAGVHDSVESALAAAFAGARAGDRIVAFGSFFVAAATIRLADKRGLAAG